MTAAFVAGGAIVLSALHRAGIDITTHIAECAGIADTRFAQDDAAQLSAQVEALASKPEGFAVLDETVVQNAGNSLSPVSTDSAKIPY